VGGQKQIEFSLQGPDLKELERLTRRGERQDPPIPGLVDLDSSAKPDKPVIALRSSAMQPRTWAWAWPRSPPAAHAGGRQTVGNWRASDDQTYDVNVRLAPESRDGARKTWSACPSPWRADGSPRIVRLNQVATVRESTGANQINRRDLTREVAVNANVAPLCRRGVGRHPQGAGQRGFPPRLPLPVWRLHQEHGRVVWLRHLGAGAWPSSSST
jgi:HAE1 family hydrophobic/amphiphilic exporter-1